MIELRTASLRISLSYNSIHVLHHSSRMALAQHISKIKLEFYTHLYETSLCETHFSYLQSSVWILPASVCSKHSARSPAQAMRQDWIQVASLPSQRRQQVFVASNREHLYCSLLCGCNALNDEGSLSKGFVTSNGTEILDRDKFAYSGSQSSGILE